MNDLVKLREQRNGRRGQLRRPTRAGFGTGFSALSYLLAFPFDKIKIDGSFVRALDSVAGAHIILGSIASIGQRMGIVTTAEGIETAAQLRSVRALGYTEAQGFLIAKPMSRHAVHLLLDLVSDPMLEPPMAVEPKTATGTSGE